MSSPSHRNQYNYSDLIDNLDLDAFYEAIGFQPFATSKDNDIGYCLFPENHSHGDTTGKFAIHRTKRVYSCFRCGGGSLVSLVMNLYGWDKDEAMRWMRQFAYNDVRSETDFINQLRHMLYPEDVMEHPMPYFNMRSLDAFDGPLDYFYERGISETVAQECLLKYGINVVKRGKSLPTAGAVSRGFKDYQGDAAIFPHFWEGKLLGWQYRWVDHGSQGFPKWIPKYTNTTSFPKHNTLFNFDWALTQTDRVIVCESVPTVLFLRSLNIPAVAYFGNAPSDAQLKLMRKFNQGVILAPDNDSNGDRLLATATPYLQPYIDVWHLPKLETLGAHADLGDFASMDNAEDRVWELILSAKMGFIAAANI